MAAKNQAPTPEGAYKPMAAPKITDKDRIEALEARIAALENRIIRHEQYHFGREVSK
jgi:hypothetical protein